MIFDQICSLVGAILAYACEFKPKHLREKNEMDDVWQF
jgi:hypothetical protein